MQLIVSIMTLLFGHDVGSYTCWFATWGVPCHSTIKRSYNYRNVFQSWQGSALLVVQRDQMVELHHRGTKPATTGFTPKTLAISFLIPWLSHMYRQPLQ